MKFIDLSLKKVSENEKEICRLSDSIDKNKIIIILGAPGSGKSTILKKYESENKEKTKYIKIKEFIKFNTRIEDTLEVLLLDGLDEYRIVSSDKTFVVNEIGHKLKELLKINQKLKVVISCREMDWYGESDKNALKDEILYDVTLFNIKPLTKEQQSILADILNIQNKDMFLDKFQTKGFLDNPQMFWMLSEVWKNSHNEVSSKTNLYEQFILQSRENNINHDRSAIYIEEKELFKISGYLAFYYIFSGIDKFDDSIIDKILDSEKGFSKDSILNVLKTKIFRENKFIHRTIAEYLLAKYIKSYKLEERSFINKNRVKSLFMKNNRIPTELRGTYAWLCSVDKDIELIKIDPYYQAIHADNSLFDTDSKKEIIKAVREYSKNNPYFFEFGQKMELEGFYNEDLDDLLIEEYNKAIILDNHYIYFLNNIILQSEIPSKKIIKFSKDILENNQVKTYYKSDFIKLLKLEFKYLKYLLKKIRLNELLDIEDLLKEELLKILYPSHINNKDIVKYLMLYTNDVGGYCFYLFNTEYKDKFELIDEIYKKSYDKNREQKLIIPYNLKIFIEDYFLETLLEYNKTLTAKQIYENIIKHFKKYMEWYTPIKFQSYKYEINDRVKEYKKEIQQLANELYGYYIDDMLTNTPEKFNIYGFNYYFDYMKPNNQSEVLFKKLNAKYLKEINLKLFFSGLNLLSNGEQNKPIINDNIKNLIEKYNFEEEYKEWLNPKKQDWEIENENFEKDRLAEIEEIKRKNEEYFKSKQDSDIQKTFSDLNWITNLTYTMINKEDKIYLEEDTFERLKKLLKNALFCDLINPELLTLISLAKNSEGAHRSIDIVYYVSLCLNENNIKLDNIELEKYLYLNVLHHEGISNIIKTNYNKNLESTRIDFVKSLLKEYIGYLIKEHIPKLENLIMKFIEEEDNLENLKLIAKYKNSTEVDIHNSIFENFIFIYGFKLSIDELTFVIHNFIKLDVYNKNRIEALQILKVEKDKFTITKAIGIYELIKGFSRDFKVFKKELNSDIKVKIINYMMNAFYTEESIKNVNGIQSSKNDCADFLKNFSLKLLDMDELKKLKELQDSKNSIWKYRILNELNSKGLQEADNLHGNYSLEEIKKFILTNSILSQEDFFTEICFKIEMLKQEIEDNRNNDKDIFYNTDTNSNKTEEEARDIILQRLKDKYREELNFTKELHEANNRVDINLKYIKNLSYEVQIECKRGDNKDIYKGIESQLINKYFSSNVQNGIYLIFYFGKPKNKELMLKKVYKSLTSEYEERIKIFCIDLRLSKN
ncbi:NACHT domain-containing protein [Aliarcobacter vitoriensis]|uniref:NACHT domain-containing protein n=2 Tax=Aliarcobacter TaxID=2321111 RepID=UPI003AABD707